MKHSSTASLLAIGFVLAASSQVASAGTTAVSFVQPERFSDAGSDEQDRVANLAMLSRHLEQLGQRLAPNQMLKVDILDVDLAGELSPRRVSPPIRIVRGRADFPRIHLRYSLEQNGQVVRSGDEWIQDLNYTRGSVSLLRNTQPLYDEKRLLTTWFDQHIAPAG